MNGDCCHSDEGYDDGMDAARRAGIDTDLSFADLLYEWALTQREDDTRTAALLVVERMGAVDVEDLAQRVNKRQERMLIEYKAAKAAA